MSASIIPNSLNGLQKQYSGAPLWKYTVTLDEWVLMSLFFQFMLVFLRRFRKYRNSQLATTGFYLEAIIVTNYAMGMLQDEKSQGGRTGELRVFWAPFLILHMGGPSNITVLSLADNELWLRYALHLVTLSYTFGRVFLREYFLKHDLWVATSLVFLAGAIRYIERVTCLFRARLTKFRDSALPHPDPGVNYARLMNAYRNFRRSNIPAEFRLTTTTTTAAASSPAGSRGKLNEAQIIQEAYRLFKAFQGLFVSMAYSYSQRDKSRNLFLNLDANEAFNICGAELKLAFDVFYTKSLLLRNTTMWAALLNLFVLFLQLASLVLWIRVDKSQFRSNSVKVTHALVYGSIAFDLISLYMLFTSDWVVARVCNSNARPFLQKLLLCSCNQASRQGSQFIPQFNLIRSTFKSQLIPQFNLMRSIMNFMRMLSGISYTVPVPEVRVSGKLQKFLFHELQIRSNLAQYPKDVTELCGSRGMWALTLLSGKYAGKGLLDLANAFGPWIWGVDFEESVVLWHIATTLCCALDEDHEDSLAEDAHPDDHYEERDFRGLSKIISDYMLYLLFLDPTMMAPSGKFLGWKIFRDTQADAERLFRKERTFHPPRRYDSLKDKENEWVKRACEKITGVDTDLISPEDLCGQESRSVLFDGSVLAKKLWGLEKMGINKWEVISKVWAEMLFYAAAHSRPSVHVEKLAGGAQLLTAVWLLMAHLGLGKHFRHNKAKDRRAHLVITKLA